MTPAQEAAARDRWSDEEHNILVRMTTDQIEREKKDSSAVISWTKLWKIVATNLQESGFMRSPAGCGAYWKRLSESSKSKQEPSGPRWDDVEHSILVGMTEGQLALEETDPEEEVPWPEHWQRVSSKLKTKGYVRSVEMCEAYWDKVDNHLVAVMDEREDSPWEPPSASKKRGRSSSEAARTRKRIARSKASSVSSLESPDLEPEPEAEHYEPAPSPTPELSPPPDEEEEEEEEEEDETEELVVEEQQETPNETSNYNTPAPQNELQSPSEHTNNNREEEEDREEEFVVEETSDENANRVQGPANPIQEVQSTPRSPTPSQTPDETPENDTEELIVDKNWRNPARIVLPAENPQQTRSPPPSVLRDVATNALQPVSNGSNSQSPIASHPEHLEPEITSHDGLMYVTEEQEHAALYRPKSPKVPALLSLQDGPKPGARGFRLSPDQRAVLEAEVNENGASPSAIRRRELAILISVNEKTIRNWFNNYRHSRRRTGDVYGGQNTTPASVREREEQELYEVPNSTKRRLLPTGSPSTQLETEMYEAERSHSYHHNDMENPYKKPRLESTSILSEKLEVTSPTVPTLPSPRVLEFASGFRPVGPPPPPPKEPALPRTLLPNSSQNDPPKDQERTRCICGLEKYTGPYSDRRISVTSPAILAGYFVQCETCRVWQHAGCVGFLSEELCPAEYFCELCKPNLHSVCQGEGISAPRYPKDRPIICHGGNTKGARKAHSHYQGTPQPLSQPMKSDLESIDNLAKRFQQDRDAQDAARQEKADRQRNVLEVDEKEKWKTARRQSHSSTSTAGLLSGEASVNSSNGEKGTASSSRTSFTTMTPEPSKESERMPPQPRTNVESLPSEREGQPVNVMTVMRPGANNPAVPRPPPLRSESSNSQQAHHSPHLSHPAPKALAVAEQRPSSQGRGGVETREIIVTGPAGTLRVPYTGRFPDAQQQGLHVPPEADLQRGVWMNPPAQPSPTKDPVPRTEENQELGDRVRKMNIEHGSWQPPPGLTLHSSPQIQQPPGNLTLHSSPQVQQPTGSLALHSSPQIPPLPQQQQPRATESAPPSEGQFERPLRPIESNRAATERPAPIRTSHPGPSSANHSSAASPSTPTISSPRSTAVSQLHTLQSSIAALSAANHARSQAIAELHSQQVILVQEHHALQQQEAMEIDRVVREVRERFRAGKEGIEERVREVEGKRRREEEEFGGVKREMGRMQEGVRRWEGIVEWYSLEGGGERK